MRHALVLQDVEYLLWLSKPPEGGYCLETDGDLSAVALEEGGRLIVDGEASQVSVALTGDRIYVHFEGQAYELLYRDPVARHAQQVGAAGDRVLRAPMPGAVVSVAVVAGQAVTVGETLAIIESMKLETVIRSPRDAIPAISLCGSEAIRRR